MLAFGAAAFAACSQGETIDVYAPDGAPALALAQLMNEEMQFGSERRVEYNVVAASTIQTYVQGDGQAELCVMPLNAAAQALAEASSYDLEKYTPAIILMTDGVSDYNYRTFQNAWDTLGIDVPVFSITFGAADPTQLEELAEATGGRVFDGTQDLTEAFRSVKGYN